MPEETTFDALVLIGRPAAGKSEIIDYLKNTDPEARRSRFHIDDFLEVDDFPMIWSWFEEDAILARHGRERLHTDGDGYFLDRFFWHLLIERVEQEYWKIRDESASGTAILEFSRGSEHGGYREAFSHISQELWERAAIIYIDVSYEESLRKNRRRFNPSRPHSILEHALPDEKLRRLYGSVDWEDVVAEWGSAGGGSGYLTIGSVSVPYAVFENHDDVTTDNPEALGARLESVLSRLWQLRAVVSSGVGERR